MLQVLPVPQLKYFLNLRTECNYPNSEAKLSGSALVYYLKATHSKASSHELPSLPLSIKSVIITQLKMKLSIVTSIVAYAGTLALAAEWSLSTSQTSNCTIQGEVLTFSSNTTPIPCTPVHFPNRTYIVNENVPNCQCM